VAASVLFVRGFEDRAWDLSIEDEFAICERGKFAHVKARQNKRLVDQGALSSESVESGNGFRLEIRGRFPCPIPATNRLDVEQRPSTGHLQQLH